MENFLIALVAKNTIAQTKPDFDVLRSIGSGSYGKVYSIVKDGELRALKIQEFYDKSDGGVVAGALREYLFFRLFTRHPNILTCESAWRSDNLLFTILPLYSTNAKVLREIHLPSFNDFLFLASGVCKGLQAMHTQSWMHRDIKLENILVDEVRGACLADFNLTRWACTGEDTLEKTPWFHANASSHICTLWTRAPEVVLAELSGNSRCPYSTEFDMFSLGATLLAFIARDYVFGSIVQGMGKTGTEKYLNAYLDVLGCNDEIKAVYGHAYTEGMPSFSTCESRLHELLQKSTMWSKEQKDKAISLIVGLVHPIPSKRFQWDQVNAWFNDQLMPTGWTVATAACLKNKRYRLQQKSVVQVDFSCSINNVNTYRKGSPLSCDTFWGMCGNSSIPPQIACEAMRIKFRRPYSLQESQAILFILDVLHNYSSAAVSGQLCFFSPEDIWEVAQSFPPPRLDILKLATQNRKAPFKICCLASELATTGDCEQPDKLEDNKIMHLSTSAPYFAAYGNQWKSQVPLRQTWVRLCSLGWAPTPQKSV
jgi:serine/threonine protein kinase